MKTAEAERATATRPMAERGMREAMEYALNTDGIDGVVIDRGPIPLRWMAPS